MENIEFSGARVPDRNGAGIRPEGENLTVRNCRFYDCEDGILGGSGRDAHRVLRVRPLRPGRPTGHALALHRRRDCTKLVFRYNYSTDVIQGHLLKSRAKESWVLYNRLTDEAGTGSAVADFPNGGLVVMVGNILHKGPRAQNNRVVAYGMEGIKHQRNALYVVNNTMVYENRHPSSFFVRVENVPGGLRSGDPQQPLHRGHPADQRAPRRRRPATCCSRRPPRRGWSMRRSAIFTSRPARRASAKAWLPARPAIFP